MESETGTLTMQDCKMGFFSQICQQIVSAQAIQGCFGITDFDLGIAGEPIRAHVFDAVLDVI